MNKKLNTTHYLIDWNTIIVTVSGFVSSAWAIIAVASKYFQSKKEEHERTLAAEKQEKEAFIKEVVIATMKATLDSVLGDIKDDITILFKYREEDRQNVDRKFEMIMNKK